MSDQAPAPWEEPVDPIRAWARAQPEQPALRDRVSRCNWTYAEFDAACTRWAAWLEAQGIGAGDRVAVLAGNRSEMLCLLFACLRRRAALVPLNWRLARVELLAVLDDARPALFLAEARLGMSLDATTRWHDIDQLDMREGDLSDVTSSADISWHADDVGIVLYTSGSTGRPKGAMLPVRQLVANAVSTVRGWQLRPTDVAPITTPLFHTAGWNVFALPLWWIGGTIVLAEPFDATTWLHMLSEECCTVAFAVPTQLSVVAESKAFGTPLPALQWIMSGGAPCPGPLQQRIRRAGYVLREGFGMTEFGPNCFTMGDDIVGVVGHPMPFAEMRLMDEGGRDVADGIPGELWLRGPQRFAGYLLDPLSTSDVLTADGWYRSGDILVRDAQGRFRVCGRRKELFISGGENVFPGEVEAALVDHPHVSEAVVVAIPDETWGEVGHAFVVARAGSSPGASEVVAHVRDRLAGYKVPKRVTVIDEMPRLGSGKADRAALAARAIEAT